MKNSDKEIFKLTEEHIKLLSEAYIVWDDGGAPAIDSKRPYGDSGIRYSVAETLGWPKDNEVDDEWSETQLDHAWKIHTETAIALQIILITKKFQPGTYYKKDEYDSRSWVLKNN